MNAAMRSYLTAGVAVVGAGSMALAPIQALPTQSTTASERAITTMAVQLASTIDPITPWVNTITTAGENITALIDYYLERPIPLAQTIWNNLGVYMSGEDTSTISDQIRANINTFFYAPWSAGTCVQYCPTPDATPLKPPIYAGDYISDVPITTPLKLSPRTLFGLIPPIIGGGDGAGWADPIASLINFTATPYSGQLVGLIGPGIGPWVSLSRSVQAARDFAMDGDNIAALNEIINIPANMTNGFLNGAGYLDLTNIVGGLLPEAISSIGLNLGGFVSPPVPFTSNASGSEIRSVNGGVMFDSLAVEAEAFGIKVKDPGFPVSWIGAAIGLGQLLGEEMTVTPVYPTEAADAVAPAAAIADPVEAPAEEALADVAAEEAPVVVDDAAPTGDKSPAAEAADKDNSGGGHTRAARTGRG